MTAAKKLELNGTTMLAHVDAANYHADPCIAPSLTASIAWVLVNQSPLHAWSQHPRFGGSPSAPTVATERGDLMHALLLGRGKELEIIRADDYKTVAAREARDAARAAGRVPVLEERYADAESACRIITGRLDELDVKLNPKKSEIGMLWLDRTSDGSDVQCRALIDNFTSPTEYDVKTIGRATREAITAAITDYGAHVQRAAYRRGLELNYPNIAKRLQQRLLFVETSPPFDVVPVRLSAAFIELGETLWQRALDTWSACVREEYWPGVLGEDDVMIADAPAWYVKRFAS